MSGEPRESAPVHPNLILAVLSLAGLAYAVLSSAVIPALPSFQHSLHTSETGVTWLLTAFLVSASVGTSIIGRLGDMYGKERLLFWTLAVLAVGTLLAAVSQSLPMLIGARVIQGVGGGIVPLAFSIARDEFPRERVAGSIGLMSSILGGGGGLGLLAVAWITVEIRSRTPLGDMTMMRIRGVWTTNLVAFLLGAGLYSSFIVLPQFAQLPKRTGFGFGASAVVSSLYLLPAALLMGALGTAAGRVARRFGSKSALVAGTAISAVAFGWAALAHPHPPQMLITATLLR